ncbi:hypothetical protein CHU95_02040 [Niveispirillum lacus]|uniref:Uncharacterized protein n=1 Tax=Niveispirillum lacus TaxID=1981099 RepID=A0A255Z940_9PROT|nr:sulfotransferase domain-containing protein [Niveispirillum lacus]OYQ37150.1 hypothetical protein CHU95_02040 [Niveispirillum lacus]
MVSPSLPGTASGSGSGRILINSIPKSGTYLLGKLLESLGFQGGEFHFRNSHYWDWTIDRTLEEHIENQKKFRVDASFGEAIERVGPGYFYAHLYFDEATDLILKKQDVRTHFFLVRELREALVSMYRFQFHQRGKEEPEENRQALFAAWITKHAASHLHGMGMQIPWVSRSSLTIPYADLIGDRGPQAQADLLACIAGVLDLDPDHVQAVFHRSAIGLKTRTYIGRPSRIDDYWSDAAETVFLALGGDQMNRQLGG